MLTFKNTRMTSISLRALEISLVLTHPTTSWRSSCRATRILLLLLLNDDITLRFEMLPKLTPTSCCLVAQELVSLLLVRLVPGVVVAWEVGSQVARMGARSFLGRVAQWEIVLGGLLPVVESGGGIHWDYSLPRTTLGSKTLVTVGDGAAYDLFRSCSVWILTCDQSRRMLESRTWINPKHLLRPRSNHRSFGLPVGGLAQIMFEWRVTQISRRTL